MTTTADARRIACITNRNLAAAERIQALIGGRRIDSLVLAGEILRSGDLMHPGRYCEACPAGTGAPCACREDEPRRVYVGGTVCRSARPAGRRQPDA